jgi:3',5'-cyclic AMP phosphodiesterase CpdA
MMASVDAQHPRPDHFLVHVSDTHLVSEGLLYGDVDAEARLADVFAAMDASGLSPEAVIFTGDLADKGEPGAYRKLRRAVESAAATAQAQLIWVMGNHDDRRHVRSLLLDEDPDDSPLDRRYDLGGLRVLVLDSSVPGFHHGDVSEDQLSWLAGELQSPAPDGTLLVLHHPPIPLVQDLAVVTELRNQRGLARVVENSDVIGILAGHLHLSASSTFANVPVSVASSTCYTQDLAVPEGGMQGRDGAQTFNFVHLYGRTVVNSVVTLGSYPPVGVYVSAEETRRRLSQAGIRIPDARGHPRTSLVQSGNCR